MKQVSQRIRCVPGATFGCIEQGRMFVDSGCRGFFTLSGSTQPLRCGFPQGAKRQLCPPPFVSAGGNNANQPM